MKNVWRSTMNENLNKFYVYELINSLTNKVIYVGKGCGNRMYNHIRLSKIKKHTNDDLQNTILYIIENGGEIIHRIVKCDISETMAYEFEIKLISEYGLSNLCNKINHHISYYSTQTMKGKTYEELYGYEKAAELRNVRSNRLTENNPAKLEHVRQQVIQRNLVNNPAKRDDVKQKISESLIGRVPWNKGVFGYKRNKNGK